MFSLSEVVKNWEIKGHKVLAAKSYRKESILMCLSMGLERQVSEMVTFLRFLKQAHIVTIIE